MALKNPNPIVGGAGNDLLIGTALNDVIDGGLGADIMIGGFGDDTYYVDNVNDIVVEGTGKLSGKDTVITSVSYSLNYTTTDMGVVVATNMGKGDWGAVNVENITLIDQAAAAKLNVPWTGAFGPGTGMTVTANDGGVVITDQTTLGGNTLIGGAGNDTFYIRPGDVVVEQANGGTDTVVADFSYALSANVENLTLTGSNAITASGNSGDNVIDASQNTGASILIGGGGNDTFILNNPGDVVIANPLQVINGVTTGVDTIKTPFSYTLGADQDNLVLLGNGNINGFGNALSNKIVGNSGNNILADDAAFIKPAGNGTYTNVSPAPNYVTGADTLMGGNGNDTYFINNSNDIVVEGSGKGTGYDTVIASVSYSLDYSTSDNGSLNMVNADGTVAAPGAYGGINVEAITAVGQGGAGMVITGNSHGNTFTDLTVNGGITMNGGVGNDTYIVKPGDVIIDAGGVNTVQANFSFDLNTSPTVQNLTLTGSGNINGTGNAMDNVLIGNSGANVLAGGLGNDTYYVGAGDTVVELPNQGYDIIYSSVDWAMSSSPNVEELHLTDSAIKGTGGADCVAIYGNNNANILSDVPLDANGNPVGSAAKAVTMVGGNGNDTYYVTNSGDIVDETGGRGSGIDTVYSTVSFDLSKNVPTDPITKAPLASHANVENLTLLGTANIDGTGNALGNTIIGNSGNNVLTGGAGHDILTGGGGKDTFVMNSMSNYDTITDFASGTDKLAISMAGIKIGNGDTVINGAVTQAVPNGATGFAGFDANAELVVFTYNAANVTSTKYGAQAAAMEIGHANANFNAGDTRLFVVNDGANSAAYLYTASGAHNTVSANELTLLCTMNNCAATTTADYGFVA